MPATAFASALFSAPPDITLTGDLTLNDFEKLPRHIQSLDLSQCTSIPPGALEHLLSIELGSLNLSSWRIEVDDAKILARHQTLKALNVSNCRITRSEAVALVESESITMSI